MVVPHRVVQAQAFVAVAPAVTGARVFLNNDGGHAQPAQARAQRNAALPAADDQHVRLLIKPQSVSFMLAVFKPALAPRLGTMLGTLHTVGTGAVFKAFEFRHGGQERPRLAVLQAQMAAPACNSGLKSEPGIDHATGLSRAALQREVRGLHIRQPRVQHRANCVRPLLRANVPGKAHQITPVAIGRKQRHDRVNVATREDFRKVSQPGAGNLVGGSGKVSHRRAPWGGFCLAG